MAQTSFRQIRKFLTPRWLTEGDGGLVGYSLDLVKDAFVERARLGHLARFPQNGPAQSDVGVIAEVPFSDYSNASPLGIGQPFVQEAMQFLGDGRMVTKVTFLMWKVGNPTGLISCNLSSNAFGAYGDFASANVAPVLGSATSIDITTLSTTPREVTFVFPTPVLCKEGVPYWVDIGYFGGDASNFLAAGNDNETRRIIAEYPTSNADSEEILSGANIVQRNAEGFVGDGSRLQAVRFSIRKATGSPTGNITVKLYSSSGTTPNAVIATSSTVLSAASLTTSHVEHSFLFDTQPVLTDGVTYWVSLEYNGGDASNNIGILTRLAGTYSGGNAYYNDGAASWFANTRDICFAVDRDPYIGRHRIVDNPPTAWFPVLNNMVFKLEGYRLETPTAPADALAALGRDRRVVRGLNETLEAYAERLIKWLDDRRTAGNAFTLMQKLAEYTGDGCVFKTVDAQGNWFVRAADGTTSYFLKKANWEWDSHPLHVTGKKRWSRFWVIIHPPDTLWKVGPNWGAAGNYADVGKTWGTTATPEQVSTVRAIVSDWKPAHAKCVNIIIAFDPNSFDPAALVADAGMPNYLWEYPARNVNGVMVPARLSTARYWDGV